MLGAVILANVVPMAGATQRMAHLAVIDGSEIAIVAIVFGAGSGLLFPLVRAWARRLESRGTTTLPLQHLDDRLDRIERSVEAIALEVERVSEGQRFVTKLLADKASPPLPPAHP